MKMLRKKQHRMVWEQNKWIFTAEQKYTITLGGGASPV